MRSYVPQGSEAWERGERYYTDTVYECPVCGRQTNVAWATEDGRRLVACGTDCANAIARDFSNRGRG